METETVEVREGASSSVAGPLPEPAVRRRMALELGPAPPIGRGPEAREEERRRLVSAVRAAHGAGVGLTVRIATGPKAAILLGADGPGAARWGMRALGPVFGWVRWRAVPESQPEPFLPRWLGIRVPSPSEGIAATLEPGGIVRTILLGFAALPPGSEVVVRLHASRGRPRGIADLLADSSNPTRPAPARPSFSGHSWRTDRPPTREIRPVGLLWRAELELRQPRTADRTAMAVVEAAWRATDGSGVRFVRAGRWRRSSTPFGIIEQELLALLPTPELVRGSPVAGPSRPGIPVGREVGGSVAVLPVEPENGRHAMVLGETGMGKSSLLVALARRAAAWGPVIVLDPLGETGRSVAEELAAAGYPFRLIAPREKVGGMNVLSSGLPDGGRSGERSQRRSDSLVQALRRIRSSRYPESTYWGPRIEEMLGRALRAASVLPGGTLEEALALLSPAHGGRGSLPRHPSAELQDLVERVRERPEDAEGARRLLFEIVHDPTLRAMLCAKEPELSTADLARPGISTIVVGDAAEVGEFTARYLLSVQLALLWSELLGRDRSAKTFVVLDEAPWFAHESLAEMLRLGRRCNLHVVVATQSLAALPRDVAEALRTNAADTVAFRGSPEEAREYARLLPGLTAEELMALPRGVALHFSGKGEQVARVRTARVPALRRPSRSLDRAVPDAAATPTLVRRDADGTGEAAAEALVWEELERRAAALPPGALLRISRSDLTGPRGGGVSPTLLRRLGGRLGRRKAIVSAARSGGETVWWVDPEKAFGRGLPRVPSKERPSGRPSAGQGHPDGVPSGSNGAPAGPPERQ